MLAPALPRWYLVKHRCSGFDDAEAAVGLQHHGADVGVQWHPEDPAGSARDRRRLFGGFLKACASTPASTTD